MRLREPSRSSQPPTLIAFCRWLDAWAAQLAFRRAMSASWTMSSLRRCIDQHPDGVRPAGVQSRHVAPGFQAPDLPDAGCCHRVRAHGGGCLWLLASARHTHGGAVARRHAFDGCPGRGGHAARSRGHGADGSGSVRRALPVRQPERRSRSGAVGVPGAAHDALRAGPGGSRLGTPARANGVADPRVAASSRPSARDPALLPPRLTRGLRAPTTEGRRRVALAIPASHNRR